MASDTETYFILTCGIYNTVVTHCNNLIVRVYITTSIKTYIFDIVFHCQYNLHYIHIVLLCKWHVDCSSRIPQEWNIGNTILYKWKNHFYEMKGDVGMSLHEKERNKKMPTQDTKSLITPSLHLCFALTLFVMNALGKANSTTS